MKQLVSIVMGSDSDLSVMSEAARVLDEFHVRYEIKICSAHRSPKQTHEFAASLEKRGIRVVIAGAGGAAHLAGVIASWTTLPVIGVPIYTRTLGGIDSLFSVVSMPPGVPVATVGINAAKNAALLAIEILSVHTTTLRETLNVYKKKLSISVYEKNQKLQRMGFKAYRRAMEKGK